MTFGFDAEPMVDKMRLSITGDKSARFSWNKPLVEGEYWITITASNGKWTARQRYPLCVRQNTAPTIDLQDAEVTAGADLVINVADYVTDLDL